MLVTRIRQSVMAAVVVAATVVGTTGLFGALSTPAAAASPDGGTSNAYGVLVKLVWVAASRNPDIKLNSKETLFQRWAG